MSPPLTLCAGIGESTRWTPWPARSARASRSGRPDTRWQCPLWTATARSAGAGQRAGEPAGPTARPRPGGQREARRPTPSRSDGDRPPSRANVVRRSSPAGPGVVRRAAGGVDDRAVLQRRQLGEVDDRGRVDTVRRQVSAASWLTEKLPSGCALGRAGRVRARAGDAAAASRTSSSRFIGTPRIGSRARRASGASTRREVRVGGRAARRSRPGGVGLPERELDRSQVEQVPGVVRAERLRPARRRQGLASSRPARCSAQPRVSATSANDRRCHSVAAGRTASAGLSCARASCGAAEVVDAAVRGEEPARAAASASCAAASAVRPATRSRSAYSSRYAGAGVPRGQRGVAGERVVEPALRGEQPGPALASSGR